MKIAVLAPCWFPVPPTGYGGIEWVVSLLADGLVDSGPRRDALRVGRLAHEGEARGVHPRRAERVDRPLVLGAASRARTATSAPDDFDVINDHSGPFAAALGGAIDTPVVHTVHGPLDGEPGELYDQVARVAPETALDLAVDEPAQAAAGPATGSRTARTRSTSPSTRSGRTAATTCSSSGE